MSWVRVNRRVGAWAALFAFALQIALSFGHVHLPKIAASSASAAGFSLAQSSRDGVPGPDRHGGANDVCAICATIGLIASSALPEPASLTPPPSSASAWPREFDSAAPSFESHFPFQARAPPVVG